MAITQGSDKAVVDWQSFSIGAGGHVDIRQPGANASMLNRVTGSTTSAIHGRLTANGQVHLVNPNGIFIGPTGTVDAGGFVASTLDISDDDFVAGRLRYRGQGKSATVENAGRVTIGRGGYAALLGGRVRNSGVVAVPMGRIAFGSGERAVLDLSGDQFLQVAVPTGGEDGEDALIENSGLASAQGGLIEMRAATAREAARQAVNLDGVAEARSVSMQNGTIVLGGGAGGTVNVSGNVSTRSAPSAQIVDQSPRPPRGPEITITGQRIRLTGAEIDASGAGGGGRVRIGGDFAGAGDLPRADYLVVDDATTIRADALGDGDGGTAILWSDVITDFHGTVSARGGDTGGNGGLVEVSGKQWLSFGGSVDTQAPAGATGTLLLDPFDVTISDDPTSGNVFDVDTWEPNTSDANINTTDLETTLASTNVEVLTGDSGDGNPQAGNITLLDPLTWASGNTLTLTALGEIRIDSSITALAGGLVLDAQVTAATGDGGSINVNQFFMQAGDWIQNPDSQGFLTTVPTFSANDFSIGSGASFQRVLGGDGSGDPYEIFDIYGLQGIGTYGSDFLLANDIDGSDTSGWTPFLSSGFQPIDGFTGALDGDGFTVSGLFQDVDVVEGVARAGMFEFVTSDGSVTNLNITGADFTGDAGGILAADNAGDISNTRVSGTISAEGLDTGGMVGSNSGTIRDSIADVNLTTDSGGGTDNIGGFVGSNTGTIDRSHATGPVTVDNSEVGASIAAGGFVGEESGTTSDSYATGNVTVDSEVGSEPVIYAGGFAGYVAGTVERSYSTGQVNAIGDATFEVGGFAGGVGSGGGGSGNFWDTQTSGQTASSAGDGATGLTTAEFQDTEGFISTASSFSWDFEGTWAPGETGFYPVNYSTSPVIFAQPDDFSAQYGQTPTASTTGSTDGGPDDYVFDEDGDTLDTSGAFTNLTFPEGQAVGTRSFGVTGNDLRSANGVAYRVVGLPGEVEITPAPLTITPDDDTKTFGETFVPSEFSITEGELFFSDTIESVDLEAEGAEASAPIDPGEGSYSITIGDGGATGTGLENYVINTDTSGILTITPAPLTIIPEDGTKTYGESFTPTEFTVTGTLFFSDTIESVDLVAEGAEAGAPVDPGDGGYRIFVAEGGVTGTGLENYSINTDNVGTLTITPAPLTITPNDQTKLFGETFVFDGTEFTASGFVVAGDGVSNVTLFSAGAPAGASPGQFPILLSGFTGPGIENYDVTAGEGTMTVQRSDDAVPRPPLAISAGLPNPPDSFTGEVTIDPSGSGQIERQRAAETLVRVQDIADDLEIAADACGQSGGDVSRYLACLADALDSFGGEMNAISLDLPPGLENVGQIIQTARTEIDGAATRAAARLATATTDAERQAIRRDAANEAQAALATASDEIRKAITLVRAEDPELANLQRATITTVADAVDNVGIELARVTDL